MKQYFQCGIAIIVSWKRVICCVSERYLPLAIHSQLVDPEAPLCGRIHSLPVPNPAILLCSYTQLPLTGARIVTGTTMRAFIVSWMFKTDHQRFIESGTCDLLPMIVGIQSPRSTLVEMKPGSSTRSWYTSNSKVEGQHHPKVRGTGWLSRMGSHTVPLEGISRPRGQMP
jgi:hypothetical protein